MLNLIRELGLPITSKEYLRSIELIFSKIASVEGDIIELGVAKGRNSVILGKLCKENKVSKKYIGFDTFSGYTEEDIEFSPNNEGLIANQKRGRWNWSKEKVDNMLEKAGLSDICSIVTGDLKQTLPKFLGESDTKVSLLYIDCNAYLPSIEGMRSAFSYMSKGSIICIDEHKIGGETKAIKCFAEEMNLRLIETGDKIGIPYFIIVGEENE